ncbi:hypothetical protein GP2143_01470 [marine gamma proteobacterium HTCC2143]|uniref:Uncharacterized protein n=1 Tax=marine gamma proteobacterium HTCC2143 TaxID=247633 RepID=A0YGN2_9GAMM|nr:hypothetical protein GP2143_01470 [marine gamma proteobacterium HTCC2143]
MTLSLHYRPFNKSGCNWNLSRRQSKSLAGYLFANALHFIQNLTGENLSHPVFHITLTFTLTNFKRLLSNWLIWKNTNPNFTATLNVTSHCTTCSFNLASRNATATGSFQTELTKAYFAAPMSQATIATFHHLAKFCTFRL